MRIELAHRPGRVAVAACLAGGLLVLGATTQLRAHGSEPTYAEDVAPILYKNCASCHRDNGMAPFSVLDHEQVLGHLDEIRDRVSTGIMPPWYADGPRGMFTNDRRLTDVEKQTILRWIDAGAPLGDLKNLPPKPEFSSKWQIGTPDQTFAMQEDFTVPASGTIEYQYFEVPTNLTEDKWVQAVEVMPGAREVVHHVIVYARSPKVATAAPAPSGAPRAAPLFVRNKAHATPPEPPRADSLHFVMSGERGAFIGGTAVGTDAFVFPPGTAVRLRAGSTLVLQMHYTAHGHTMNDRTTIGVKYAKEPPEYEMFVNAFENGAFTIPAGAKDVAVPAEISVTQPVRIWGLMPHTHLRGTRWQYKLEKPDSTSELILDVPRYDFNWQTFYMFAKPLDVPAGGKITSTAWYDNSASNPHNPNPKTDVRWGAQTWEEMQFTGFMYTVPSRRLRQTSAGPSSDRE